jgi:hypothetical protein
MVQTVSRADISLVIAVFAQVTVSLVVDGAARAPEPTASNPVVPGLAFTGLPPFLAVAGLSLVAMGLLVLLISHGLRKVRSVA